jgi:hypothetical protein
MPERMSGTLGGDHGTDAARLPLTSAGRLKRGMHTYSLAQLRPLLATTPYRRIMWNRFIAFIGWPILDGQFSHAYMGGGYPTARVRPKDIDLILQTRASYGPEGFHVLERYFRVGLETIEQVYGIHLHFWMEDAPPGVCDYRTFFQYARPRETHAFDRQGLVRIPLDTPGIKEEFRELVGGIELLDDKPE